MEIHYGYDEYQPDMQMGVPEDLMRAQQYNVSADLRCANSNNERPDWRARGVEDPWLANPKFHDPSMQDRIDRGLVAPPGCRAPLAKSARYGTTGYDAQYADMYNKNSGTLEIPDKYRKESFSIKESCAASMDSMDFGTMLMLLLFVFVIYMVMGCRATIKKLKKEIKQLRSGSKQIE